MGVLFRITSKNPTKEQMLKKEQKYALNAAMLKQHPQINDDMRHVFKNSFKNVCQKLTKLRILSKNINIFTKLAKRAILLDWMMEVCFEMGFLRLTFHLAAQILDRFLSSTTNFRRDKLQVNIFWSKK